jgi:lysophospholipase L1-like esterase
MLTRAALAWLFTLIATASLMAQAATPAGAPPGQQIRFQEQIQAFLDQDRTSPPPQEGILFIGSSIFRQWTNVKEHMAPLPVFNRAFGGSRTWEILHYMDRIVLPYQPRIIVFYCGSNDINAGEKAPAIVARFQEFVARVHAQLPATRIFFASVHKAPQKRDAWDVVEAVNANVQKIAAAEPLVDYVEMNPLLFDAKGEPRMELYRPDGLHFHPPAYDEFARLIKPIISEAWGRKGEP